MSQLHCHSDITLSLGDIDWYHPSLTRHLAESLLLQNGVDGTFLLRPSSLKGEFALSVRCVDSVKHFPVQYIDGTFKFGMAVFNNLKDLQAHFEKHPLIGAVSGVLTVLKYPYSVNVQEPDIYDEVKVQAQYLSTDKSQELPDFSVASKEGFLTKQGSVVKNWKVRWFVLKKNELKYFKTNQDKSPIRTLNLKDCTEVAEDRSLDKQHAFRIVFPWRTFYLYASTEKEGQEWIDILQWKLKYKDRTRTELVSTTRNSFDYS